MKKIILFIAFSFLSITIGHACTAAVITGKVTADGRPLLWKTRDTDFLQNGVKYFKGSKYNFYGIVNCKAEHDNEIWMGTNSAGFSIMNTQSFNLEETINGVEPGGLNGNLMYRALQVCGTVKDFINFLDTTKLDGLCANFGVIDAKGGAGWCETSTKGYKFFDANDPQIAPDGYIARTNFSVTGKPHEGFGYARYCTEEEILKDAAQQKNITKEWLLKDLARSFKNAQLGIDLTDCTYNKPITTGWFLDTDLISRKGTSCTSVIHGVKIDENPELSTMWLVNGYPPVSVAFPFWIKEADTSLPKLYTSAPDESVTPFGKKVDALKERVYALHEGIGSERYFYWEALFNKQGNGIMQKLAPVEKEIFKRTNTVMDKWYKKNKIDSKEMKALYNELSLYVEDNYKLLFDL